MFSGSQEFLNEGELEEEPDGNNGEGHSGYVDEPLIMDGEYDVIYDAGSPAYNIYEEHNPSGDNQNVGSLQKQPIPPSPKTAAFQAMRDQNTFDYGYDEPIPVHKNYHSSSSLKPDQISMHSSHTGDMQFVTHRAKSGQTSDTFI